MAEPDREMTAPAVQEAGGDHAVATVATAPSQHEHRLAAGIAPKEALARPRRDCLPGYFHQLQHRDADVVDHDAIDPRHLVRSEGRDRRRGHGEISIRRGSPA